MVGLIAGDGVCVRIKLPVLVLGSGANADVILDGLADLHCLFTPTPAGVALRSFAPEATLVNGDPASAALLKDGDVISVGTHQFVLAWPITLEVAEPEAQSARKLLVQLAEERMANDLYANARREDIEKQFAESQQRLDEDRRANELIAQNRVAEIEAQCEAARQRLAEERQAQELHAQNLTASAEDAVLKARQIIAAERLAQEQQAAALLAAATQEAQEIRQKIAAERQTHEAYTESKIAAMEAQFHEAQAKLAEERANLAAQAQLRAAEIEQQFEEAHRQLAAEHERLSSEAEATNHRIATAWASLTAAQQQLADERRQAEREFATHLQLHEARKADLDHRESGIGNAMQAAIEKMAGLNAEIAGLEARATHARMLLADVEKQQPKKAPPAAKPIDPEDWSVPLNVRNDSRSADQLILQLRQQEHEVGKERQRLAVQLQHAAQEREQLQDQRALVAEQIRQLEATRRQWQAAETQTVGELEKLARSLEHREAELNAREGAIAAAEAERKVRGEQLAIYRKELDEWQAKLLTKEKEPVILSYRTLRRESRDEVVPLERAA